MKIDKLSQSTQVFKDLGSPEALGIVEDDICMNCSFVAQTNTTKDIEGKITVSFVDTELAIETISLETKNIYVKGRERELLDRSKGQFHKL